jgi:hypothetical protein
VGEARLDNHEFAETKMRPTRKRLAMRLKNARAQREEMERLRDQIKRQRKEESREGS